MGQTLVIQQWIKYITYGEEAFMLTRVKRYNVKGRKYIGTPYKFILKTWVLEMPTVIRQIEETHIHGEYHLQ